MLHTYLLVIGETGMRRESEALWLRWEDVELAAGFIHIVSGRDGHRTKSGKSRSVPMTARLRTALGEHAASYRMKTYDGERTDWVFHHTTTRYVAAGSLIQSLKRHSATERHGR